MALHRKEEKEDENVVRAEAATALGWLGDKQAVEALLVALQDSSARVRAAAATAFHLGKFNDARAKPLLIAALSDENTDVREWATRALCIFKDEPAIEQLQKLEKVLYSEDKWQRYTAASTLAKMGEAGIDILLTALQNNPPEKLTGIITPLGFSENQRVIEPLIEKLRHPVAEVRTEVAVTWGFCATWVKEDKTPVPALIEAVRNPTEEPQVLKEIVVALQWFEDKRAIEPLVVLLEQMVENPPRRPESNTPYDETEAKKWRALMDLRDALINALTHLKATEAVELLIRLATDETDSDFRRSDAIRSLGYIEDKRGFETVLEALKNKDGNIREAAASALGYFGDPRSFEPLVNAFYQDTNLVPSSAIVSLGKLKDERSYAHLLKAITHKDLLIRYSAARGLGEFGDVRAIKVLLETLTDPNPEVRFEAAEALGKLKAKEALPQLKLLAENDQADVCYCCHAGSTVAEGAKAAIEVIEAESNLTLR
jgi:HEAT repeat protein